MSCIRVGDRKMRHVQVGDHIHVMFEGHSATGIVTEIEQDFSTEIGQDFSLDKTPFMPHAAMLYDARTKEEQFVRLFKAQSIRWV